jgi:hypothetical protein
MEYSKAAIVTAGLGVATNNSQSVKTRSPLQRSSFWWPQR